jgi:NAD(P)-dependent dehydrogenase (short-subunit alcohol dehydrogenase family)
LLPWSALQKKFTGKEPRFHALIDNAGIMAVPFEMGKDGYESQWQTNYVAHWLLTHHLLPTILATAEVSESGKVGIANDTSVGHRYNPKGGIDFQDINQVREGSGPLRDKAKSNIYSTQVPQLVVRSGRLSKIGRRDLDSRASSWQHAHGPKQKMRDSLDL